MIEFESFPKILRWKEAGVCVTKYEETPVMEVLCERPECHKTFTPHAKARNQKYCSPACRHSTWVGDHRQSNNARMRLYRARRYAADGRWLDQSPKAAALKAWMVDIKSGPCADCGGRFEICCMDFDHRRGQVKTYNLGSMFAHHYSRELIEVELAKCDLVCSNCHRVRTRDRRTGSGKHRSGITTVA